MTTKWADDQKEQFINHLARGFGTAVSRGEIIEEARQLGLPYPRFILDSPEAKAGRGMYNISCFSDNLVYAPAMVAQVLPMVKPQTPETKVENLVPTKESQYVPFGFFKDLKSILQSKIFYPVFITGLSGNGKTTMVEQVCADLKRECIRVNISIETDEDDLIGGNTLVNGNIVYR